jgi:Zn-dependent protease with chaperone function
VRSGKLIQGDLARVAMRAALALFLIPLLLWGFSHYVLSRNDATFLSGIEEKIRTSGRPPAEQQAMLGFYRATPPSLVCGADAPALADYRQAMCEPLGFEWQFFWAQRVAQITVCAGTFMLLSIVLLGVVAFRSRPAQYTSLMVGWRLLALCSAVEVILQSSMAAWLSFWVTAYFFEFYSIKLIAVIGIGAAIAAFVAVVQIFARTAATMAVDGELVLEAHAPALWARVRALAGQIGTAPPDHIVAGIDANFFVTETALSVQGRTLGGRSLFVSLPLLRVLDQREADAVLAHELAHLRGGDTASSAAIGPKLVQFDSYRAAMSGAGLTIVAFYMLTLYRIIFELALKRDSREREFMADKAAADVVGGNSLVRALIKVAGYSAYRHQVEQELFAHQSRHDSSIGIADFVAQGLPPFAHSGDFLHSMATASIPHPFDSHPALSERMHNVDSVVAEPDFGAVMVAPVVSSWASRIDTAAAIETRLWAAYEAQFAQAHEQDLAYRYLPANEAERALVEKYFPPQAFVLKGDKRIVVACDGLTLPADDSFLAWDTVKNVQYEDGMGGDVLKFTITERGVFGDKTVKVKLPGIKPARALLKAALGNYWHRHKVARSRA